MFFLRALHSFAARLVDKKPDKSHLQPELARAANDSSATTQRTNIITIIINRTFLCRNICSIPVRNYKAKFVLPNFTEKNMQPMWLYNENEF